MNPQDTVKIRLATEADVEAVCELFLGAYGEDYPFKQFYDPTWLKRAVFDGETLFLLAEHQGRIVGTVSVMLAAGDLDDLIGELGRLVVDPNARGMRLGTRLVEAAIENVSKRIHFGFAEGRTAHSGSQKILDRSGFGVIGFEPLKYKLGNRESMVMYGKLFGRTAELRRNHPRIIPELAPLAMRALTAVGLPQDVIVVDDEHGYPSAKAASEGTRTEIEDLTEQGWSPLLRIERGRVRNREVFGNLSLSRGFFKIKTLGTRYLVARQNGSIVGGLGFAHDPIDEKVRIFELIGLNDSVKGALLEMADRIAREELQASYVELDVSAYNPAIQRTLERMGFLAVAYCPSMVFQEVERLDVVRMAKLNIPYFREDIPLTEPAAEIRDLIEQSMDDRRVGQAVAKVAQSTRLFAGLDEGDALHLARLGRVRTIKAGDHLIHQGHVGDRLFIVISGSFDVKANERVLGTIKAGETVGEMTLLDNGSRSADVTANQAAEVVEILTSELNRLMQSRPRLGSVVMRNLASDLAGKLRQLDARVID